MENSLVSVVVPVYNPGKYFDKCVSSLIEQTHRSIEISLVDDGSIDLSALKCDYYAKNDNRIISIHKPNEGVSKARNVGIDISNGDYYYFPDSDDYIEIDSFEYCLELIKKHNCDAVVFEHFGTYPTREEQHHSPKEYYGLYEGKNEIVKINFRIAFTCNKLFNKKLITSEVFPLGIRFREDIYRGEDGLFSRDVLDRADRVYFTDRALYHYVQSEESACRGKFRASQLSLLKTIEINEDWYKQKYPEYLPKIKKNKLDSLIMLYSDMYLDYKDYKKERDYLYRVFLDEYKKKKELKLSSKEKIKYFIFCNSPKLFTFLHRINVYALSR